MRKEKIIDILRQEKPVADKSKAIYGLFVSDHLADRPDDPINHEDFEQLSAFLTEQKCAEKTALIDAIQQLMLMKKRGNKVPVVGISDLPPIRTPEQTGFKFRNIPPDSNDPPIIVRSLDTFEEREPEWLIPDYIPLGCVTLLVGDGGVGKGMLWTNLVASITSGKDSVFDEAIGNPYTTGRANGTGANVLILSQEDDVEHVLHRRLKNAGVDMRKTLLINGTDPVFTKLQFGTGALHEAVRQAAPRLVILDPLQAFIPDHTNLCDRGDVRKSMSYLMNLAAEFNTAILVVVHTNKKSQVWGRQRMADSADIWDAARSVLLVGVTDSTGKMRYVSAEKHNYTDNDPPTVLYGFEKNKVVFRGTTEQKDRDFVSNMTYARTSAKRNEANAIIRGALADGQEHAMRDVKHIALSNGVSEATLKRTMADLRKSGRIVDCRHGFGPNSTPSVRWKEGDSL